MADAHITIKLSATATTPYAPLSQWTQARALWPRRCHRCLTRIRMGDDFFWREYLVGHKYLCSRLCTTCHQEETTYHGHWGGGPGTAGTPASVATAATAHRFANYYTGTNVGSSGALLASRHPLNALEAPPRDLPKADVAGPLLAYRQWSVIGDHLCSIVTGLRWEPGMPLESEMDHENPPAYTSSGPWVSPGGSYASKSLLPLDYESYEGGALGITCVVTGRVALWGRVIEHERGYRAQYAYPFELFLPGTRKPAVMPGFPTVPDGAGPAKQVTVRALAARYGIPVVPFP